MLEKLRELMLKDVSDISFEQATYHHETFFADSIRNNFAGWYDESSLQPRVEFIIQKTQIPNNGSILDGACGHGKFAEILSEIGYQVTGIDISAVLINHLNAKYHGQIKFMKESMEDISFNNEFDSAMILGNSLSLVPDEKAQKTIQNLQCALKTGGKLFLELDNREYYLQHEANTRDWSLHQNRWLTFSEHLYQEKSLTEISRDIGIDLQEDSIAEFITVKRLYSPDEIKQVVSNNGFHDIKIYGDWDGQSFREDSPKILLVARKRYSLR